MKQALEHLLSENWAAALGWTLLHSLWQALAILLLVHLCLRLIPAVNARARHLLSAAGLFLFLALSAATFIYLYSSISADGGHHGLSIASPYAGVRQSTPVSTVEWEWNVVRAFLDANMPMFLLLWAAGLVISVFRLAGGVWYAGKLRASAVLVGGEWAAYVQRASRGMGIHRFVRLAESAAASGPMVIGYLKPVILIPLGMLSGLSTEQIETVLVHELAHIRRHDYLVNLVQSFAEALFFFNPFVWTLSAIIRKERECCCDDVVLARHGGATAYAHALAELAAWRLDTHALALPLASDKHQLLYRIRRIMERSMKNYSPKGRILLPATVLVAGLLCVSWLGVQSQDEQRDSNTQVSQDTVKRKGGKSATYSRKRIVTIDENGQPHEDVVEEFEGDEDLRPLMQGLPGLPALPSIPAPPLQGGIMPVPDSLPHPPAFPFDEQEWDAFGRAFGEDFGRSFQDLPGFDEEQFADLMRSMEERFQSEDWAMAFRFPDEAFQGLSILQDSAMFHSLQEQLRDLRMNHLRPLRGDHGRQQGDLQDFEKILKDELIKDGYLASGEEIESLSWSDQSFKVNGKDVRKSDREKYRDLRRKYLEEHRGMGKFE